MNRKLVNSNGRTMNSRTLKTSANAIDPAAVVVAPTLEAPDLESPALESEDFFAFSARARFTTGAGDPGDSMACAVVINAPVAAAALTAAFSSGFASSPVWSSNTTVAEKL